jgi:hypothetical protein
MPAESLAEGKVMAERRSLFSSFSFGGDDRLLNADKSILSGACKISESLI